MLAACLAYGTLLAFVCFALRWEADYHWWATVLLFTPRWFWAVPLIPLAAACGLLRRRVWLWSLAALMLAACLVLNVEVPWRKLIPRPIPQQTLRVLSCNCDGGLLQMDRLRRLVADFDPDVVALQAIVPHHFAALFPPQVWFVKYDYRLALASRYPIRASEMLNRSELMADGISLDDFRRYELDVDGETIHFANVHLQSPRFGLRAVVAKFWGGADCWKSSPRIAQARSRGHSRLAGPLPCRCHCRRFQHAAGKPDLPEPFRRLSGSIFRGRLGRRQHVSDRPGGTD